MGNENLRPWERQDGETEKAFSAFKAYLEMEDRNVTSLAKRLSKTRQLLVGWKQKYNWQERCIAWDKSLQEIEYKTAVKERKKMAKRHIAIAMSMQAKAVEALKKIDVSKLNAGEIIRLFDTAVKIERLSRGEATFINSNKNDNYDEKTKVEIIDNIPKIEVKTNADKFE